MAPVSLLGAADALDSRFFREPRNNIGYNIDYAIRHGEDRIVGEFPVSSDSINQRRRKSTAQMKPKLVTAFTTMRAFRPHSHAATRSHANPRHLIAGEAAFPAPRLRLLIRQVHSLGVNAYAPGRSRVMAGHG